MNPRLALAGVTITALAATFTGTAAAQPAHRTSHPVVFHGKASGKTIAIKAGTTFKVSLEACGDCGDHWTYSHQPDSSVLKQVGPAAIVPDAGPGMVGGNDHRIWTFKGVGKGETTMRMVERSAEKGNKVIKHFTLTVKVHDTVVAD